MLRVNLLLFFLIISLFTTDLFSQAKVFSIAGRKLSLNEELSQGRVKTITEDSRGVIWIGTLDGLNSFDGYTVKKYHHEIHNANSLSNNIINSLSADDNDRVWIATDNGLNYYSIQNNYITRLFETDNYLVADHANKINEVEVDDRGIVWYATAGAGIVKFDPNTGERQYITINLDPEDSLNQIMIKLAIDHDNNIWFANTFGQIGKIDSSLKFYEIYETIGKEYLNVRSQWVSTIFIDQNNKKWFLLNGRRVGLYHFDEEGNFITEDKKFTDQLKVFKFSTSLHSLGAITSDNDGNLWLSSIYQGIFKLDQNYNVTYYVEYQHDYSIPELFMESGVLSLFYSRTGTLWYGLNGYGLGYINNFDFLFTSIKKNKENPGFVPRSVRGIEEDDEEIWVCGYYGLTSINKSTGQIVKQEDGSSIYSICNNASNKDELFIGTEGGGIFVFDKKTKEITGFDKEFVKDSVYGGIVTYELNNQGDSILWIGTNTGLQKFNYKTGDTENISFDINDEDGPLTTRAVICSYIDRKGDVWFGTMFQGLWKYDPEKNIILKQELNLRKKEHQPLRINCIYQDSRGYYWISTDIGVFVSKEIDSEFKHYTVNDGLPNDFVYASLEDELGNMWFSTNNGLSNWNYKDSIFTNYDISSGIQNKEFNTGAYFKDSHGNLYFGGIDGLTFFKPEINKIIEKSKDYPLILTQLYSNNGEVKVKKNSDLNYTLNLKTSAEFLNIEFSLLSYLLPEQNYYQYRNLKRGSKWIDLGNSKKIFLNQPTAGKQTLEIRAGIKGKDNFSYSLKLTIIKEPHYWQTWWFWIIFGITLTLVTVVLVLRKIWLSKEEKRKLTMLVNIRTRELNETNDELRESNDTKDRLFSIIAHDLRNPLNSLLGFSSLLETQWEDFPEKEKKEFASIIHSSSKNLNSLLDNLLNWSRLQMKNIKPSFMMMELEPIVDSNLAFLESSILRKNINIDTQDLSGGSVFADPDIISIIIRNLLSNAVKFTHDKGSIKLSLERENKYCKLSITDNGMGIDEETLENLFDVKKNTSKHGTNNEMGTGLGLLLCHDFAVLNNGKITVTSEVGKGSCFMLYLPVK